MHPSRFALAPVAIAALALGCGAAQAFTFESGDIRGNFDSTVQAGLGLRMQSPSCSLITEGATGPDAPAGCLAPTSLLGDQGNLNYGKHDLFAGYLKGTHELFLKLPQDFDFLFRFNWVADGAATNTTGITSATSPPPPSVIDGLADDAYDALRFQARLLDLWVSKSFQVGDQQARVRLGYQVISWGESLFLPGGINATNAMDIMRMSQPGTQLKEVYIPAPILSISAGLGHGFNVEGYVQFAWNASYFPPTGSYWSVVNGLGKGSAAYGLATVDPSNGQQWGVALRYQPAETQLNLGIYALAFQDKTPNFSVNIDGTGAVGWTYAKDRRLYGISANFPVGDLAVGTELSYRPKDAVALNSATSGCSSQNGNCWVDESRWQWALTGLLSLTPNTGGGFLKLLGADTATLLAEAVVIHYPNLKQSYGPDLITAGGWGWGQLTDPNAAPQALGSKTSSGINFDFSWVYDGTIIPGWQVVPEIYYFRALSGHTPNLSGLFMSGASSANFIVSFIKNPATWQVSLNYATFWGGSSALDQPLSDRDFFGVVLSRNF